MKISTVLSSYKSPLQNHDGLNVADVGRGGLDAADGDLGAELDHKLLWVPGERV